MIYSVGDRHLDPPEIDPARCACGRLLTQSDIRDYGETCETCRVEDCCCSRCGESLTVADYRRGDTLCIDCYRRLACLNCTDIVSDDDLTHGDGLCGVCRERETRAREASA